MLGESCPRARVLTNEKFTPFTVVQLMAQ